MEADNFGNAFTMLRSASFPRIAQKETAEWFFPARRVEGEQRLALTRRLNKRIKALELAVETYEVEYEVPRKKRIRVAHEKKTRDGFFEQREFYLFHYREDDLLLALTSKQVAWSFRSSLDNKFMNEEQISLSKQRVNITELQTVAQNIRGAWFSFPSHDPRRASSIWADRLTDTEEYQIGDRDGELSVLYFDYPWAGDIYRVGVSTKGTIQIIESDMSVNDRVGVALSIWSEYLEPILR